MAGEPRPGDALSDTQRRFLGSVMSTLPRQQVREVYMFAPMRQGGVETGIAIVAVGEPGREEPSGEEPAAALDDGTPGDGAAVGGEAVFEAVTSEDAPAPEADAPEPEPAAPGYEPHAPVAEPDAPVALERPERFTIFTARYRLQVKGPERGKWDVDVVEEADAPLVTIDEVVRGVHARSGEASDVERLEPRDLARALGEIPWTSES